MRENAVVIDYTAYLAAADLRKELPAYVLKRIDECVDEIVARHPEVTMVRLIGSYSNGTYVDTKTSEKFKSLKEGVGKKVKISDFDFETTPFIAEFFETKNGHKVHLWKPYTKKEGSLLWQF